MPGTEDTPDELDSLMADLDTQDSSATQSGTSAQPGGQWDPSSARTGTSSHGASETSNQAKRLLAGRFQNERDLEKSYLEMRKERDSKFVPKLKVLEEIVKNPALHQLAQQNPAIRAALAKAGYQLAEEEEEAQGMDEEEDESSPLYQLQLEVQTMKLQQQYQRQYDSFVHKLGRGLTEEEHQAVVGKLKAIDGLSVEEAWMLTPHYAKQVAREREKAVAEATRKAKPRRPMPHAQAMPGEKLDLKKHPGQMNEREAEAFLNQIIDRTS